MNCWNVYKPYLKIQPDCEPFPESESEDKDYLRQRSSDDDRGDDDDDDEDNDSEELPSPTKSSGISRPRNHCRGNKQLSWQRITK